MSWGRTQALWHHLVVASVLLCVVGCGSTEAPAGMADFGDGDIRRVAEAMATARSFRMRSHGTNDAGDAFDVTIEVVRPDRQHTRVLLGAQSLDAISIGQDVYTNLTGTWLKVSSPAPGSLLTPVLNADEIVKGFEDGVQHGDKVTLGSREVIDGVQCQALVVTPADPNDEPSTMWIGVADSLPRRLDLVKSSSTIVFSDWNAAIHIEPPPAP
jgi:hypothetical protein